MTPPAGPTPTTTLVLNKSHLAVAGGFAAMLLAVIGLLGGRPAAAHGDGCR
jgi:hypothetical protein